MTIIMTVICCCCCCCYLLLLLLLLLFFSSSSVYRFSCFRNIVVENRFGVWGSRLVASLVYRTQQTENKEDPAVARNRALRRLA